MSPPMTIDATSGALTPVRVFGCRQPIPKAWQSILRARSPMWPTRARKRFRLYHQRDQRCADAGGRVAVSQRAAVPFCVVVDPMGRFVYVANADSNNVSAYTINASTGALTPVAGSPFGAGTEPLGVAIDPSGKFAYVTNAGDRYRRRGNAADVSAYTINASTGALTPVAGSPFGAQKDLIGAAVAPTGKFLYVTDPTEGEVSAYKINATNGALKRVKGSKVGAGYFPYYMEVAPTGKFAYVANQISNNVSAYTVNAKSGALTPVAGSPFGTATEPLGVATCRVTAGKCIPPPL